MLKRSASLRRTAFKPKARAQILVERAPRALPAVVPGLFRLPTFVLMPSAPVIKEVIVRCDAYLRLVAARPCIHCGIQLASQAAHENSGKGKQMKVSDLRSMPLCHEFANRCHQRFDQYQLFPSRAEHITAGARWARQTAVAIKAEGNWPAKHPFPYSTETDHEASAAV